MSPECENCYIVDTPPLRAVGQKHGAVRVQASEAIWLAPYEWDDRQRRDPPEPQWRVFCMSLGDWLDTENVPLSWTSRVLQTVMECEHLTWLMLTKRSENWKSRLIEVHKALPKTRASMQLSSFIVNWLGGRPPDNVWFGASIMNGKVPASLLEVPARVRWISAEPLLKRVDLVEAGAAYMDAEGDLSEPHLTRSFPVGKIDWAVVGGESGKDEVRRDCGVEAICDFAQQCVRAGIRVFVKQDCARKPGQQGRIPDHIWMLKQYPKF